MLLNELLKCIKKQFMVDEKLIAYLYSDKIELVDFTSGFEIPEKDIKGDDFYGFLFTIYLKDNKISCIENNSIHLITPANKDTIIYLANLIDIKIEDYDSYEKLPDISQLKSIVI